MQTARRRIKRRVHANTETDAILEHGKQLGREEGKVELEATKITMQAQFDRDMVEAQRDYENKRRDLERDKAKLQESVEHLREQLERLQKAFEARDMVVDYDKPESTERVNEEIGKLADFQHRHRRSNGVPNEYVWQGWPVFEICADVKLFVSSEVRRFLSEGRLHSFARGVQQLYENALHTGRVATIISDPIAYRGNVGVFVKGGTARDAAAASQAFDR